MATEENISIWEGWIPVHGWKWSTFCMKVFSCSWDRKLFGSWPSPVRSDPFLWWEGSAILSSGHCDGARGFHLPGEWCQPVKSQLSIGPAAPGTDHGGNSDAFLHRALSQFLFRTFMDRISKFFADDVVLLASSSGVLQVWGVLKASGQDTIRMPPCWGISDPSYQEEAWRQTVSFGWLGNNSVTWGDGWRAAGLLRLLPLWRRPGQAVNDWMDG